jgi:hypothetical protein
LIGNIAPTGALPHRGARQTLHPHRNEAGHDRSWSTARSPTLRADGLRAREYQVLTSANPLRAVAADAGYVRDFVSAIEGDVVLVGRA